MSLPALFRAFRKQQRLCGEVTRLNSAGQFKPFVYLNGRDGHRQTASKKTAAKKTGSKKTTARKEKPRLPAGPFLSTLRSKLAAGVLLLAGLLTAALLVAALLLAGLLARVLILLTRLLLARFALARLVLVLAGHLKDLPG
jgi:hypothetical protein